MGCHAVRLHIDSVARTTTSSVAALNIGAIVLQESSWDFQAIEKKAQETLDI
jgi:hypothetical protein